MDLEYVEADFKVGEHEQLDREIRQLTLLAPPPLLAVIVELSGGRLRANYLNVSDCESIIKNEPRLRNMLLDGSNHGYKSVRLLSKDLSVSSAKYCTDLMGSRDDCDIGILRPPEYQSKISS